MTDLSLQEKSQPESSGGKWWTSFVLLGVLAFGLSDLGLRLAYHPNPFESSNRSWVASAVADYPTSCAKPEIVIFGSSLVVATVNDGDATTLGKEIDGTAHHRSITLERAIAETTGKAAPLTQSFAIGGQMASDAFSIFQTLFNSASVSVRNQFPAPKLIVWGIAPRDFLDATFLDPYSSTTVAYMDKACPTHDSLGTRRFSFWRFLEDGANNLFYVYGERDHFVVLQKRIMFEILAALGIIPAQDLGTVKTPQELLRIARRELPEDNGVRQWMVKPQTGPLSGFEDNSVEYRARYSPFKQKLFDVQVSFLDKFLALAKGLNIKVLLINMPLTQDNLKLIPEGKYQIYLDAVRRSASLNGASFVDYNDDKTFTRDEFNDPVHLNGYGSRKFFQMVGQKVAAENLSR